MSISPTLRDAATGVVPERRACQRRGVMDRRLITVNLDNKDSGLLVDISESGMAVQALARIKSGATAALQFELPDTGTRIETSGVVAWADSTTGRAGIQFQGLSDPARTTLREWLELKPSQGRAADTAQGPPASTAVLGPESKVAEVAALQREITNRELDRDAALNLIAERARSLTSADGAAILIGDTKSMTCTASSGSAPPVGSDLRPDSGLSGECVRTGVTVRCEDTELDVRVDREACRALKLRSAVIVPLFARGNINGLVEIFYSTPRAFDGRDVLTLRRIADLISATQCGAAPRESKPAPLRASIAAPLIPPAPPPLVSADGSVLCDVCGHENAPGINDCEKCDVPLPGRCSQEKDALTRSASSKPQAEMQTKLLPATNTLARKRPRAPGHTRLAIATVLLLLLGLLWAWQKFKWHTASAAPPVSSTAIEPPASPPVSSSAETTISESFIPVAIPPSSRVPAGKPVASKETKVRPPLQAVNQVISTTSAQEKAEPRPLPARVSEEVVPPPSLPTPGTAMVASLLGPPASSPKLSLPGPSTVSPPVVLHRVEPVYPKMATAAHVQGTVMLKATILRNGKLSMVHVLSGNDLLVPAALHAVQQWRYKPAELDGKPVETETTIKISFALSR